ncbi:hypothetical protein V1519DRAFT_438567, partial [Lipomyces tetrasporus]
MWMRAHMRSSTTTAQSGYVYGFNCNQRGHECDSIDNSRRTLARTVQALTDMRNQTYRDLFLDFNGVVRDASCVCGPYLPMARPCILTSAGSRSPGARCSIFLLTIAGEVDSYKSVTCTLSYNGLDQTAMKARLMEICSTVRKVCTRIATIDNNGKQPRCTFLIKQGLIFKHYMHTCFTYTPSRVLAQIRSFKGLS